MSSDFTPHSSDGTRTELERLLPLLEDATSDERARVAGLLIAADSETRALAQAYEADAALLAEYAATQRGDHPLLMGFADAVMARLETTSPVDMSSEPAREPQRAPAPILRPSFGAQLWIALAALFLGGLGLAIVSFDQAPTAQPAGLNSKLAVSADPGPVAAQPDAIPAESGEGQPLLASPSRPGMRPGVGTSRPRRSIVPVDGRGGSQQRRQVLQDLLQMQGWSQPTRVPPLSEGERELDF